MSIRRYPVSVTVDASGDATKYSPRLTGKLVSIRYVKPVSGGYSNGVDFVITSDETGETIWSEENVDASATRYPRVPTHSTAGAAALYAAGGAAVNGKISLGYDRVKIVVAAGGNATTGMFYITLES